MITDKKITEVLESEFDDETTAAVVGCPPPTVKRVRRLAKKIKQQEPGYLPDCASFESVIGWATMVNEEFIFQQGFCVDCTPEHRRKMEAQGKCNHPEVEFYWWAVDEEEGGGYELRGYRDTKGANGITPVTEEEAAGPLPMFTCCIPYRREEDEQ